MCTAINYALIGKENNGKDLVCGKVLSSAQCVLASTCVNFWQLLVIVRQHNFKSGYLAVQLTVLSHISFTVYQRRTNESTW